MWTCLKPIIEAVLRAIYRHGRDDIFFLSENPNQPPKDGGGLRDLPQLDEFYFTTAEKKILENCRCIVPNFIND
jgi:hypothetical protein